MILQTKEFKKERQKQWEGACTIGNGYVNIRGSLDFDFAFAPQHETYWRMPANVTVEEAKHPYSKWGTYIPGIVGQHPLLNEEMLNLPYLCGLNFIIDGERFQLEASMIRQYEYTLHMEEALLEYRFTIAYQEHDVKVKVQRYCDSNHTHIVKQNIELDSEDSVCIGIECFVDMDVTTNGYQHLVSRTSRIQDHQIEVDVTSDLGNRVVILQEIETTGSIQQAIATKERASLQIEGKGSLRIVRTSAIATSLETGDPKIQAIDYLKAYQKDTQAYAKHQATWKEQWNLHRITITGDEKAQQALDFSVYHLMRSKSLFDFVAIDAKGAAGEAYFGHYFWDTEIYLLPFYLYSEPQKAKDLLMFRVHTLDAAMENAQQYGYEGAKYPWESSISGTEQCPNWQYKDHEIHISFDIVYAMQAYYKATSDEATCKEHFFPVVEQVAQFALSRSYRDRLGNYHINGVMGPDEYIMYCDDNSYTNVMACYSVKVFLQWCEAFKYSLDPKQKTLYEQFCDNIVIPSKEELILQCKDFEAFEDIDFDTVWKHKTKPFGAQISQEHNYRCKALKQADTLSLFYLFDDFYPNRLAQHMNYYLPLTTHDSSLSYVIHSILFQRLHRTKDAYTYFEKACGIDLDGDGAAEGIHIANAGGLWQAIVFGFAGMTNPMWNDTLEVHPQLPAHWSGLSFQVKVKDVWYRIAIDHTSSNIQRLENPYAK